MTLFCMLLAAPAGNDILFAESLCEQGRNFCNKIWNAFRLVKGWEVAVLPQPEVSRMAIKWFDAKLKATVTEMDDLYSKYRLNEALMTAFKLFTDEFSGWYLEMVKPAYQQPIDRDTYDATLRFFDKLMKIIHPFMPFITEELWQHIYDRKDGESIMVSVLDAGVSDAEGKTVVAEFETVKKIVAGVRAVRNQKNIAPKEPLELIAIGKNNWEAYNPVLLKMSNLSGIRESDDSSGDAVKFMVGTDEYAVPVGNLIDLEAEIKKQEAELKHLEGFLIGIQKKLGNERFVNNAPVQVVELERKKLADTESKISAIKETLASLRKQ